MHDICLCYRDSNEIFYEGLGYSYIDLSNFVKTKDECVSHLDNWLYSLKHLDEMDRLPPHLKKTIFEKLYNIAEYSKMTKSEQDMYDQDLKRKWDNDLATASSREKGKAEGKLEGKIEGKLENSRQVAFKMKSDGMSADLIAKYTDLSIEEIERL